MLRTGISGVVLVLAIATLGLSYSPTASATDTPAIWAPHAIIVDLESLPKTYSCDDLWYRFRAVLLDIGAQSMTIMPYHCDTRSPSVELQFSIPKAIQGAEARYSQLQATNDTIVLAPGRPAPLDATDCELVRQIKDELFPALPIQVAGFQLNCGGSQTKQFRVVLTALLPESKDAKATAAAQNPSHSDSMQAHSAPASPKEH